MYGNIYSDHSIHGSMLPFAALDVVLRLRYHCGKCCFHCIGLRRGVLLS